MKNVEKTKIICIDGDSYAFNLDAIKEFCLTSDKEKAKEQELIENYETNETTGCIELISKISREVKSAGNPQNDTIVYDMLKLFIGTLLSSEAKSNISSSELELPTAISFNTLIEAGMLYKL